MSKGLEALNALYDELPMDIDLPNDTKRSVYNCFDIIEKELQEKEQLLNKLELRTMQICELQEKYNFLEHTYGELAKIDNKNQKALELIKDLLYEIFDETSFNDETNEIMFNDGDGLLFAHHCNKNSYELLREVLL